MYRVKLIKNDGKTEMKRFRGALEAQAEAEYSVKSGAARQAFVYVDSPDGLKMTSICTNIKRGE